MVLFPEGLKALKEVAKEVGLNLRGAYLNLDGGFDSAHNRKCIFNAYFTPIWTRFLIAPLSLSFHRASPRLGRCAKHNSKTGFPSLEAQHLVFIDLNRDSG